MKSSGSVFLVAFSVACARRPAGHDPPLPWLQRWFQCGGAEGGVDPTRLDQRQAAVPEENCMWLQK